MTSKELKKYFLIIVGSAILSFGLYNIHRQSGITEGGELGVELLLYHWFLISPAITAVVLDTASYLLGFKLIGKDFLIKALFATACYSFSYAFWESMPYMIPDLTNLPLLASIVGGSFVGVGVGIVVKMGGACGGDDAIAMSLSKVTGAPIERCYLFTDLVVLGLSLTYIPFSRIIYSLITVTLSSYLIGFIQKHFKL